MPVGVPPQGEYPAPMEVQVVYPMPTDTAVAVMGGETDVVRVRKSNRLTQLDNRRSGYRQEGAAMKVRARGRNDVREVQDDRT